MLSCAKEVLYIVYMKRLQYLLGTYVIFLFTNKTLLSNLVALTHRKNVPPKAIYFCRAEAEVLNLPQSFFVLEMQECGVSLKPLELYSHNMEFKIISSNKASLTCKTVPTMSFQGQRGPGIPSSRLSQMYQDYSELSSFSLRLFSTCKNANILEKWYL